MTILEALVRVDTLKKELDDLMPMNEEDEKRLWQKFRLEWNYNSNHIEGNTLTYGETQLLLIHGKATGDHELREYEEMKAHDVAIGVIQDWAKDSERDLTEAMIRDLNKIILVQGFWKDAITPQGEPTRKKIRVGEYKKEPNSVLLKSGEVFHFASPEETPTKMNDLLDFYHTHSLSTESHPVWLAAMLHHKFVLIHPFDDGNGRVARLLVNYILLRNGYPPIIIKSAEKNKYLTALQKADTGDHEAFVIYMCEQLIWSLELSIKAAKGENIEEPDDLEKEIEVFKKGLKENKGNLIEKSDNLIIETYFKNIEPFFEIFIQKHSQIRDLFNSVEIHNYINNTQFQSYGDLGGFDVLMEKLKKNEVKEKGYELWYPVEKMTLVIIFKYFRKDGSNTFDVLSSITVHFDQFRYVVKGENESKNGAIEKRYNDDLTDNEIELFTKEHVRAVFEKIKENVSKR